MRQYVTFHNVLNSMLRIGLTNNVVALFVYLSWHFVQDGTGLFFFLLTFPGHKKSRSLDELFIQF